MFCCLEHFDVVCFFQSRIVFEIFCANCFQSDVISSAETENHFRAAPPRLVGSNAVRLCIQF